MFKKCREQPNDIIFIDASLHFEKATQNYLREIDINKIVQTYRDRTTENKFSYAASIQEVKDNNYNLNIPRYVDTFEENEVVKLEEVSQKLVSLELAINENEKLIRDFCKELNISTPF